MGELLHNLGLNVTVIAQIINLFILLLFFLAFVVMIGVIIYSLININKMKQRIKKLEEQILDKNKKL